MKQSDIFRENAESCLRLAEAARDEAANKRYRRMAEAWLALARDQDWLDGENPPVALPDLPRRAQTVRRHAPHT